MWLSLKVEEHYIALRSKPRIQKPRAHLDQVINFQFIALSDRTLIFLTEGNYVQSQVEWHTLTAYSEKSISVPSGPFSHLLV